MNAALLICRMAKWPENAPYERIRIKVSSQQLKMSVDTLLRWRNRVLSVSQRLKGNLAERQGHCQDLKCQTTWTACIFQPVVDHEKIKSIAGFNISAAKWQTKAFMALTVVAWRDRWGMCYVQDIIQELCFHRYEFLQTNSGVYIFRLKTAAKQTVLPESSPD